MRSVTFQVVEGVDKGRVYRDLAVPVSIGREEGNGLRLNDERVSRFHAKIQFDGDDVIMTDLESTNGTRINGDPVQIRRLQAGDRVSLGRSVLVFGTQEEIRARVAAMRSPKTDIPESLTVPQAAAMTDPAAVLLGSDEGVATDKFWASVNHPPALPRKLGASQAARLTELLDFFASRHRQRRRFHPHAGRRRTRGHAGGRLAQDSSRAVTFGPLCPGDFGAG